MQVDDALAEKYLAEEPVSPEVRAGACVLECVCVGVCVGGLLGGYVCVCVHEGVIGYVWMYRGVQ